MVLNVFCGVVSGVLSSSLANPTDVLKVILNARDEAQTKMSVWEFTKVNRGLIFSVFLGFKRLIGTKTFGIGAVLIKNSVPDHRIRH